MRLSVKNRDFFHYYIRSLYTAETQCGTLHIIYIDKSLKSFSNLTSLRPTKNHLHVQVHIQCTSNGTVHGSYTKQSIMSIEHGTIN